MNQLRGWIFKSPCIRLAEGHVGAFHLSGGTCLVPGGPSAGDVLSASVLERARTEPRTSVRRLADEQPVIRGVCSPTSDMDADFDHRSGLFFSFNVACCAVHVMSRVKDKRTTKSKLNFAALRWGVFDLRMGLYHTG